MRSHIYVYIIIYSIDIINIVSSIQHINLMCLPHFVLEKKDQKKRKKRREKKEGRREGKCINKLVFVVKAFTESPI